MTHSTNPTQGTSGTPGTAGSGSTQTNALSRTKRKPSDVWKFYEPVFDKIDPNDGKMKRWANCKACGWILSV
ncbi:hypothetical protein, partial [Bartonella sp. AC134YNZD]|uniref:hypothetical protein n=1 Tax=Bartonella sp. AC134YNZD TaxID=3243446 RepID=UPI0035D10FD1